MEVLEKVLAKVLAGFAVLDKVSAKVLDKRKVRHKVAGRFWEVLDKVTYGRTFLVNFV